jgi:predicted regulator of Ras-like GTPase activity (Roadblock/LC7/MglB family)
MATATERVRNYRDRKRRGVVAVPIEVDGLVIGALQFKDDLDDDTISSICTDKAVLAEAIQARLSDWTEEVFEEFDDALAAGEV